MSRAHFKAHPYNPCERTHPIPSGPWPAAGTTPAPAINAPASPLPAPLPLAGRRPPRRTTSAPSRKASDLPLLQLIEAMTEIVRVYTELPIPTQHMRASARAWEQRTTQGGALPMGALPMLPQTIHLTPRQLEILRLRDDGLRPKQIAEQLYLSVATVRAHIRDAIQRLEVSGTVAALRRARLLGLLTLLLLLLLPPSLPLLLPMS